MERGNHPPHPTSGTLKLPRMPALGEMVASHRRARLEAKTSETLEAESMKKSLSLDFSVDTAEVSKLQKKGIKNPALSTT